MLWSEAFYSHTWNAIGGNTTTMYTTLPEHVGRVMHYSVSIGGSRYLKVTINNEHLDVHVILRLC